LIRRKISKTVSTRCQILRLKCTIFDFHWGCALDAAVGAYSALPDPLAVFKGPTSKGKEGVEGGEWKGREREGKGRREREGEEKGREWDRMRTKGICRTNVTLVPTRL